MSLVEHISDHVTVGVFKQDDLHDAETLARDLALRNHHVTIQSAEQLRRRKLIRMDQPLRRGIVLGATLAVAACMTVAVVGLVFGFFPRPTGTGLLVFLASVALASSAGGLATWLLFPMRGAHAEFDVAMEALAKPGRFALVVETAAARRPFVEARLSQCGAIALGSL